MDREKQLQESFWEGIRHPLVIFDREGKIEKVNSAFSQIFGTQGNDLTTINLAEVLFASNRSKFTEWLTAILHTSEFDPSPLEIEQNAHHYRADIFTLGTPERADDRQLLAMILIDITREKQIEQKKADFTSMIVHDLRGPLTAIMGSMQLVVDAWGEDLKESYKELLASGITESERMMDLINELLDISKIESGKFTIVTDRISPAPVLLQASQSMQNIADRTGIHLDCVIDGQLPKVDGDRDKLIQVVINLLSNAIKFTPEGGLVTIFAETAPCRTDNGIGQEVRISITDTGQGISRDEIPRLFTRYAQADNQDAARDKKMGGTGLGLYIVKELVNAHGGRIQMTSEKGMGTSVAFTLPVPVA